MSQYLKNNKVNHIKWYISEQYLIKKDKNKNQQ